MTTVSPQELKLELGTIIQIDAPANPALNEHIFLIQYLNTQKLVLLDVNTLDTKVLNIEDGNLMDESIQSISILSIPPVKGYARQNGLTTGTWIDVHFSGDIPITITGKITDLEEDTIEIRTYPDNDDIYIDFGYKGIPENIPIEKIHIREPPVDVAIPGDLSPIEEQPEDELSEIDEDAPSITIDIPLIKVKAKIKDILAEAADITWGDVIGTITQEVEVSEHEKRYDIQIQATDILNELLSTVPNIERTTKVLNNFHRIINRFTELRKQFSIFDKNGRVSGALVKGATYKPLVEKLYKLNCNLYWILPIVKNKRKLYDVEEVDLEDATDVVSLTMTETLQDENAIDNKYYTNKIPGEQNKYEYLIRNLNPYFTPFTSPEDMEGVIHEQRVHKNVSVLIDNILDDLEDLFSSVASCSKIKKNEYQTALRQRRFVILKYNLGIDLHKTNYNTHNLNKTSKVEPITRSDLADIKSFLLLPEPYVRFSHINLPNTTIYEKSNLNHANLAYWQLLKKNTSITTDTITDLDKDHRYSAEEFLTDIKQVVPAEPTVNEDTYRKYLQALVPKTRILFDLVKKYIQNKSSFISIISYLEPFLIYKEDLSFMQYKLITEYINININKLKAHIVSNKKFTNILRTWRIKDTFTESILISNLDGEKSIVDKYNISPNTLPSAVYAQIIATDYGNLYHSAISYLDSSLYSDFNIAEKLSQKIDMLKIQMSEDKKPDTCGTLVLAKKYIEIDEIIEDNGKDIFFDVKYDTTHYDILDAYKTEQATMSAEEFKEYLKRQLQHTIGLTLDKAEVDANAMILGHRQITDGDYAVLETYENDIQKKYYYYKRTNGEWVLDEHVTEQMQTTDANFFCNSRNKCLMLNKNCESTKEAKMRIDSDMTQKIITNMMDEHVLTKEHMAEELRRQQKLYFQLIDQIKHLSLEEILQYNHTKYTIGLGAEHEEIARSPHIPLRNLIIGEQDFVKRKYNLVRFINRFTREPNSAGDVIEDEHWLYCTQTNTKLLPSFFKQLANSTLTEYLTTLDKICKEQGKISDDQDKWVDEYSGYTIRYIGFDTDEGYDEAGRKIQSRSVLVSDDQSWKEDNVDAVDKSAVVASEAVITGSDKKDSDIKPTTEVRYINNIITSLSDSMGIDIESQRNFIVRSVKHLIDTIHGDEEEYNERRKEAKKQGKHFIPTYTRKLDHYILFFTGLFVLLAIQTAIPSIQTTKTYPNCKKSFVGFPLESDGDDSGLQYIVCVMKHTSGGSRPWKAIIKLKDTTIINSMKSLYKKHLHTDSEIKQKIATKLAYIVETGDKESIPITINVNKWKTFLPPLNRFHLASITNITDAFREELQNNIKRGKPAQFKELDIILSKLLFFSLHIQETIQHIVTKEPLLLESMTGVPFLENVCCDTKENIGCLDYFVKKDASILKQNTNVAQLSKLYNDVIQLCQSAILYSNENTKLQYPAVLKKYAVTTIYLAFLKLCKFNQEIPLKESMKYICHNNTSSFNKNDTLDTKITILKSEGRVYNEASLIALMNIVNREHIIHISIGKAIVSPKQQLEKLLDYFEPFEKDISKDLITRLKDLIDTFDLFKQPHIKKYNLLMDHLMETNRRKGDSINDFITKHGNTALRIKNKMKNFINTFYDFLPLTGTTLISSADQSMVRAVSYIKNCVNQMSNAFPMMIQNSVDYSDVISVGPKYWNLSPRHYRDIAKIIASSYVYLSRNYKSERTVLLNPILTQIPDSTKHMVSLMNHTPFMASFLEKGEHIDTLFDAELVLEMFKYYFLSVFHMYIELATLPRIDVIDAEDDVELTERLAEAEQTEVIEYTADLLMDYIRIFQRQKETINFNETTIMEKVAQIKSTERNRKVRTLKDLSDEERRVDNQFKHMKLGRWNKGIQKGLTQYVAKTYDEERIELEQEALIDIRLGESSAVIEMNRDIFKLVDVEERIREQELNDEAFDMSGLGDDDEAPEGMEGDE